MKKVKLSYWEKESFFRDIDVAIIGSGIVGLSAAIHMKEENSALHIAIFERGVLPIGASTRNAGFGCFGSLTELIGDMHQHSEQEVFELVEKRWRGLQRLRSRIGDEHLDYKEWGAYELFLSNEEQPFQICCDKMDYFNAKLQSIIGNKTVFQRADNQINKFGFGKVKHLIWNSAEGQIHTGKMMSALLNKANGLGIKIYNGITVEYLEDSSTEVRIGMEKGWEITTGKVLVCTNGFSNKLFPGLDLIPSRNQVLITKPIENLTIQGCFHYDKGYYYFRNIDQRILFGGGRNLALKAETTSEFGTTPLIKNTLIRMLKEVILPGQKFEIDQWWSGILGTGSQKKPIVKKISQNIFTAIRLGGMGIAIGSLTGEEGAHKLLNNLD